ncbi:Protein phosphatase 2C [seawater metagenome]|uniref:Protein phosphatase 2C n=1 Tax=seawater metagenome TaxID=1561972 RepID=A0A5E8CH86_9ZZZZ
MNYRINSKINNIGSQEDYVSEYTDDKIKIHAIYDGHTGTDIVKTICNGIENHILPFSSYLAKIITPYLENYSEENIKCIITKAFEDYDSILAKNFKYATSGTTATIVVILEEHVFIAYIGDSKALALKNKKMILKTIDHNYKDNQEEKKRLDECKIQIKPTNNFQVLSEESLETTSSNYHKFGTAPRTELLAISRAFGHYFSRLPDLKMGLITTPTIHSIPKTSDLEIILGTDGIWDIIQINSEVEIMNELISKALQSNKSEADMIAEYADLKWKQKWNVKNNDTYYKDYQMPAEHWDDCSCIYLTFS